MNGCESNSGQLRPMTSGCRRFWLVVPLLAWFAAGVGGTVQSTAGSGVVMEKTHPIVLHPSNPHYFLWRGKPTVLITSGEHYGAVLNKAFDYRKYLDTLASYGFNLTRTFSGAYYSLVGRRAFWRGG